MARSGMPGDDPTHEDLRRDAEERREEWLLKVVIGLFATAMLVAIVLSIQLSTLGLTFGSLVYGTNPIWPGHSASFRVAALDAQTSRMVRGVEATVVLRDASGERLRATGRGIELAEVNVVIPAGVGDRPELDIDLETLAGKDAVTIPLRVHEAEDTTGTDAIRIAPYTEALIPNAKPETRAVQIALYPLGGEAVAGLENTIVGRVTRDGAALATRITSPTLGLDWVSDAAGLFRFTYRPQLKPEALHFEIGSAPAVTKVNVPLDFRPNQLRLDVTPGPWVAPGTTVTLRVDALPFRTPIHLDVWAGDTVLFGSTEPAHEGLRELEIVLPREVLGLLRVEAYRSLFAPDENRSRSALWVSRAPPEEAATEALAALAQLDGDDPVIAAAKETSGDTLVALCTLALSRVVAKKPGMPLLRSNIKERRAIVTAQVAQWRGSIHGFLALTVLLGLALIAGWAIRHQIRVRRSVRAVMEDGIAAGEKEIDQDAIAGLTRFGHTYDLALAFCALLLATYGVWMLVTRLSWL